MNIQFYMEKLSLSEEFKKFMKENKDAYLCSGFFVIDKDTKNPDNKQHFDYYVPSSKKIFSFQLEDEIKIVPIDTLNKEVPEKISKHEFDFDEIEKIIEEEMEKQNVKSKIQKIILSLQNIKGRDYLICTVFISMLGILKVKINLSTEEVTEFEKKSFFDIMKVKRG